MTTAGHSEDWTGPRLAARLADLNGVAPEPVDHVVFRATRRLDAREVTTWQVADAGGVVTEAELTQWLTRRRLAGPNRLALAVLVIRETLDDSGLIRDCILERRRGAVDGPLHGDPARVEFSGPARIARLYRVGRDGRLTEVAASTDALPPRDRIPEHFAGEQNALRERFGPAARVVDVRQPTLFEDMVGLDSIAHVHLPDGREVGCGIGWHGTIPFILEAAFPRFGAPLTLPPEHEAAIEALLARRHLVRHETRLDEHGLAVLARRRGGVELFIARVLGGEATLQPYEPGGETGASEDQVRWMRYVETYEKLSVLDAWRDGNTDDLIVLTGETSGQVWRHHVDRDGVETWRKPDDDAAVAVLHGERLFPGTLAAADATDFDAEADAVVAAPPEVETFAPPPDSLLAKAEAYVGVLAALHDAGALATAADPAAAVPEAVLRLLRDLPPALEVLAADGTEAELRALLKHTDDDRVPAGRFARALSRVETRLMQDLAEARLVVLNIPQSRLLSGPSPFDATAEVRFPELAYDMEEAVQCLALRRPTASVFHAMRVVEHGLAAVEHWAGTKLWGEDRHWGRMLDRLRGLARPEAAGLITELEHVRRRCRAARLVPAAKYTESEAERLLQSVASFVRELGALLHDD